jgi:hypothetical protein
MIERPLSGLRNGDVVNATLDIDLDALLREVARYLAAVDAFRAHGHEPTWRPEPEPAAWITSGGRRAPRALGGAHPAPA